MTMILRLLNAIIAFLLGSFLGFMVVGVFIGVLFIYPVFLDYFSNTGFNLLAISIIIVSGAYFIMLEFGKSNNRMIVYFQGSVLKKILLFVGIIFVISSAIIVPLQIHKMIYGKYEIFAIEIADELENTVRKKEEIMVIDNKQNIDSILIVRGYGIPEAEILRTGIIDKNMVDKIAAINEWNEGIFLYLIKGKRLMVVQQIPWNVNFDIESDFQLGRTKNSAIKIYIKKV
ncbi:MAG: hypothetical protein ABII27_07480, partial [bacterium]